MKKKPSFDLQDLLMTEDSHPWPNSSPLKAAQNEEYDKDTSSRDWVDKVMVNKHENPLSHCDGDFFYSRSGHWRKDSNEFEIQRRHRLDSVTTDDSDDLDVATSDSSEVDALWQFNLPKSSTSTNNNQSSKKIKKPQMKPVNSPDFRKPTYSFTPPSSSSSTRKIATGATRISRQPSSTGVDAKRTLSSIGKLNNQK